MGRSHCDHCHRQLSVLDLIPVLSFIFLNRHCRYCAKKISFIYPFVELLTAFSFIFSWFYLPFDTSSKIIFLGIISCLIIIFFADFKYQVIPDDIQVAFILFTVVFLLIKGVTTGAFLGHILAAFLLMFVILSIFLLTHGRGMGFGDVKLAFTIGLLLGLKSGFLSLYFAFVIGAIFGLFMIFLRKKQLKSKIAFGPFLVTGIIIMLFWQDKVMELVKSLYGF